MKTMGLSLYGLSEGRVLLSFLSESLSKQTPLLSLLQSQSWASGDGIIGTG